MTFRELLDLMQGFVREHPDHEALDRRVVVRVQVGDDLHVGGLDSVAVDAGCAEEYSLVIDASDDPDGDDDSPEAPVATSSDGSSIPAPRERPEDLTDGQREKLRVAMLALRERLAARPRPRYVRADPPPIYDDVFREGVQALDADAESCR